MPQVKLSDLNNSSKLLEAKIRTQQVNFTNAICPTLKYLQFKAYPWTSTNHLIQKNAIYRAFPNAIYCDHSNFNYNYIGNPRNYNSIKIIKYGQ